MALIRLAPLQARQEQVAEALAHTRSLAELTAQLMQRDPLYLLCLQDSLRRLRDIEQNLQQSYAAIEDYLALNTKLERETLAQLDQSRRNIRDLF